MLTTLVLLGSILGSSGEPEVPLSLLQEGFVQNARLLKQYRVIYTQKIVLGEVARMLYRQDLERKIDLFQHTKDADTKARLEQQIQDLRVRIQSFDARRVEARHFDFRTDGERFVLIWPWMDPAWEGVKDAWSFPDVPVTKESLTKEYKDLTILVYDPKAERPFLFWIGAKRLDMWTANVYPSYPTIGGLSFPPLTRAEFAPPQYRNPIDVAERIKPAVVKYPLRGEQPDLSKVFCISTEQNIGNFCENEPGYKERIRFRGENDITFDCNHGFLPVLMETRGRIYLDNRPVEGENGEYPSWRGENRITKIGKIGDAYYPMETVVTEYKRDPKLFSSLSFEKRFSATEILSPRTLWKTTTWTVHRVQTLAYDLPKVELPNNTYYVDVGASKSFVTGKPDDFVNSLIQSLRTQQSVGWRSWTALGLTILIGLLVPCMFFPRFRPFFLRRKPRWLL